MTNVRPGTTVDCVPHATKVTIWALVYVPKALLIQTAQNMTRPSNAVFNAQLVTSWIHLPSVSPSLTNAKPLTTEQVTAPPAIKGTCYKTVNAFSKQKAASTTTPKLANAKDVPTNTVWTRTSHVQENLQTVRHVRSRADAPNVIQGTIWLGVCVSSRMGTMELQDARLKPMVSVRRVMAMPYCLMGFVSRMLSWRPFWIIISKIMLEIQVTQGM